MDRVIAFNDSGRFSWIIPDDPLVVSLMNGDIFMLKI